MKLYEFAAIDGPEETSAPEMHQRIIAMATEQGPHPSLIRRRAWAVSHTVQKCPMAPRRGVRSVVSIWDIQLAKDGGRDPNKLCAGDSAQVERDNRLSPRSERNVHCVRDSR